MKFKLEIDCDNSAFDDDRNAEVRRILQAVGNNMPQAQISAPLYDANGNRVGSAQWVRTDRRTDRSRIA